ncbi:hypothetical protein ACO2Q3_01115 [Caulobacter sp. KR2-114]|uniref:hypothetical protein n=1 Tax=Caulobacter sp. KR2-114 TaxID=3400912 RepID=UPI003C0F90C9
MRHALMMIAAVGLLAVSAGTTQAAATAPYKLDSAGKCIGSNGQFAKAELCGPAVPVKPIKCKDPKTKKFTKCTAPGAVPA